VISCLGSHVSSLFASRDFIRLKHANVLSLVGYGNPRATKCGKRNGTDDDYIGSNVFHVKPLQDSISRRQVEARFVRRYHESIGLLRLV
jgi:hypothetical protein